MLSKCNQITVSPVLQTDFHESTYKKNEIYKQVETVFTSAKEVMFSPVCFVGWFVSST